MINTNFSLQGLEAYLMSIFKDNSPKDPGYIGPLGNGLYRLPYGTLTGKGGWDLFTAERQRLSKNGELQTTKDDF